MCRPSHTWSVFRRTVEGFERVGAVCGPNEGSAVKAAGLMPNAPRHPIVCHAHPEPGAVAVELPRRSEDERHSRRRIAA